MKVHPAPKKRNITLRYDIASSAPSSTPPPLPSSCRGQKKLRRLPHIFAKVLELPFCSDADVAIEETVNSFKFTVFDTDVSSDVVADTVEIHPGVTKIVVKSNSVADVAMTEFELDLWRFRLPACTRPDLATATYDAGDLVVVVPKQQDERLNGRDVVWGEGNLVLVQ